MCIISFFPVFKAGFVNYDDPEYVTNNSYIKKFTVQNVKAIFEGKATILYVPLTVFTYMIEYKLFGENAKVFHAVNLLLHIINCLLLLQILLRLQIKNGHFIWLILLFFSINPLVTESVCWITERKDVLYCLFYFLAVIKYLDFQKTNNYKYLVIAFVWFILSCFSKPMAVSLPVIFMLYSVYKAKKIEIKSVMLLIPFFIVSFIFSIVSVVFIKTNAPITGSITQYSVIEKLTLFFSELGYYFLKPFLPFNQKFINLFPEKGTLFANSSIMVFALLSLILFAIIAYLVFNKKNKLFGLLFLCWIIFLLPVLQVYPNTHSYVSERYFYVSIIFPVALLCISLQYFNLSSTTFKAIIPLYFFCFIFLTFKRSTVWKDSKTLFEQELKVDSDNTYALNNLGHYYNTKKEFATAIPFLQKAAVLDSISPLVLNNYAWALAGIGKTDSAIVYFNKAIARKNNFPEALSNLGICYIKINNNEKAFYNFNKAYQLSPNNNEVLYNLGAYYLKVGQKEKARPLIHRAYELGNKSAGKYLNY